jgi:hypothetical protein
MLRRDLRDLLMSERRYQERLAAFKERERQMEGQMLADGWARCPCGESFVPVDVARPVHEQLERERQIERSGFERGRRFERAQPRGA